MSTFYFEITEEKINSMSLENYEALERAQDGEVKIYKIRPVLCRFMVDENGNDIQYEEALKVTSKLGVKEFGEFVNQFFIAVKEKAVPKANGSPSQ
jgi:hypothetical protein